MPPPRVFPDHPGKPQDLRPRIRPFVRIFFVSRSRSGSPSGFTKRLPPSLPADKKTCGLKRRPQAKRHDSLKKRDPAGGLIGRAARPG